MHWLAALSFIGFSIARPHSGVHAVERSGAEQAVEWSGRSGRSGAKRMKRSGAEWSGVERSQAELYLGCVLFPCQLTRAKQPLVSVDRVDLAAEIDERSNLGSVVLA